MCMSHKLSVHTYLPKSHSVIHEQFEVNIWESERWISVIIAKLLALKFCINNSVQNLKSPNQYLLINNITTYMGDIM